MIRSFVGGRTVKVSTREIVSRTLADTRVEVLAVRRAAGEPWAPSPAVVRPGVVVMPVMAGTWEQTSGWMRLIFAGGMSIPVDPQQVWEVVT